MKITKKMIVPAMALTVVGASVFGASSMASAHGAEGSLVEKIATHFNLNQDEVQAVFDEVQDERQAEHKAQMSEKLQAKVDDGTITAEQKTLIEQKLEELQNSRKEAQGQDLSREERKQNREQHRQELESWAAENNIPLKELDLGPPKGAGMHHRHGGDE